MLSCLKTTPRSQSSDWDWAVQNGRVREIAGVQVALLGSADYIYVPGENGQPNRMMSVNGTYIDGLKQKDTEMQQRGIRWAFEQKPDGSWWLGGDEDMSRMALELLTDRVYDAEGKPISFHGQLKIGPVEAKQLQMYCNKPSGRDNCQGKDAPLYDEEFTFPNGLRMAVQVVPSTDPDNEECWTQGVLFDADGNELGHTDVGEDVLGDYEIQHDGKWYCVMVVEDKKPRLRLVLDVRYDLNGVPLAEMKEKLAYLVEFAMGHGLVTGETAAEVYSYDVQVIEG